MAAEHITSNFADQKEAEHSSHLTRERTFVKCLVAFKRLPNVLGMKPKLEMQKLWVQLYTQGLDEIEKADN